MVRRTLNWSTFISFYFLSILTEAIHRDWNAVYPYTLVHFLRFLLHFPILFLAFGLRQWRTRSNFTEVDSKAPRKLSYFSPYRNSNGDNGHRVNSVVLWSGVSSQREVSSWREVSSLTRAADKCSRTAGSTGREKHRITFQHASLSLPFPSTKNSNLPPIFSILFELAFPMRILFSFTYVFHRLNV